MIIFLVLSAVLFFSAKVTFDHYVKNSTSSKEDSEPLPPQNSLNNLLFAMNDEMLEPKSTKIIQGNDLFWGEEIDIPIG